MATSKTASFWLTERVNLTASGSVVQGTIDLGAYVSVADGLAISVEQVEFGIIRRDVTNGRFSYNYTGAVSADATVGFQLTDLNPGTSFIGLDENELIGSGAWLFDDGNNVSTLGPDLYPDTYGKLDESRMVVNDQMYFVSEVNTTYVDAAADFFIAYVRIKCRIVKLSTANWMSIAIQSTASDN